MFSFCLLLPPPPFLTGLPLFINLYPQIPLSVSPHLSLHLFLSPNLALSLSTQSSPSPSSSIYLSRLSHLSAQTRMLLTNVARVSGALDDPLPQSSFQVLSQGPWMPRRVGGEGLLGPTWEELCSALAQFSFVSLQFPWAFFPQSQLPTKSQSQLRTPPRKFVTFQPLLPAGTSQPESPT